MPIAPRPPRRRYATAARALTTRDRVELILATGVVDQQWLANATVETVGEAMRTGVRLAVGVAEALARIDFAPLPDEPFDWSRVPPDARPRVAQALMVVHRCAWEIFDQECRTACRRFLADVAASMPGLLRRGRVETAAAAVVWAVAKGNNLVGRGRGPTVGLVLASCGVSGSVSKRAATMLEAVGAPRQNNRAAVLLGSVRYLTADRRHALYELACLLDTVAPDR